MTQPRYAKYGIEYPWRDGRYGMTVMATSPEEAMERVKAAANWGHCYTPYGIAAEIPVPFGRAVRFWTWLVNALRQEAR